MGPSESYAAKTHFEQKRRKNVVLFLQRYLTFFDNVAEIVQHFSVKKKNLQHFFSPTLGVGH